MGSTHIFLWGRRAGKVSAVRDASEVSVSWRTFERKLARGDWVLSGGGTPDPKKSRFSVVVPEASRGVHNAAGRTMMVNIMMTPKEAEENRRKEEQARLEWIRGLRNRQS